MIILNLPTFQDTCPFARALINTHLKLNQLYFILRALGFVPVPPPPQAMGVEYSPCSRELILFSTSSYFPAQIFNYF